MAKPIYSYKMRIGFDAKRLFNNFTGLGNYSRTLVKNYLTYFPGNELFLFSPSAKKTPETAYFFQDKFKTITANRMISSYWRSFYLSKLIQNEEIDIYHGLSNELPFGIHKTKTKKVVTIHDLIFKVLPETYPVIDRLIYDVKFNHACDTADLIIAISENTKRDIVKFYGIDPNKIKVLYQTCSSLFMDESSGKPVDSLNLPGEFLLYVGSVTPRKNLLTIIKALNILKDKMSIPLVIVGDGKKYRKNVEQFISKKKIKNIYWLSNIKNDLELKSLYKQASMLVYPSFYEGFGLPVLEALFCHTPVITSGTSALPEAGGDAVKYIDPVDYEHLAFLIEEILNDEGKRMEMKEKGKMHTKKFHPEILSCQLNDIYEEFFNR